MIANELQRAAWAEKLFPSADLVDDRIISIPIEAPGLSIRFTYAYALLATDGQILIIDPGTDSAEGWLALNAGLAMVNRSVADVSGIIVTHFHLDHLGLAPIPLS